MKGKPNNRGVAQLASASGLGPEGPVFESQYPDKRVVDFQLLFFCLTLTLVSLTLHFLSMKTCIFMDDRMFFKGASMKTCIFMDRYRF